jgi:spermidine synthase
MRGSIAIGVILLAWFWLFPVRPVQAADDHVLYEGDSIYHHITVRQVGMERCMIFGRRQDLRQTCLDLERPDASVFEYTSMMFAGFLFRPDTKKVCLIGLGGGYIPLVFRMHLPEVSLHTVEVDPLVEGLAKQYFGFVVSAGQSLSIDDGRQFLKKSEQRYDQIWLDAFNSDYIPAHMTTKEFLTLVKSRLTEGGIIVQNLFCGSKLYDAQIATLRSVFPTVFLFEGQRSRSCVVVASSRPAIKPAAIREGAERMGGRIGRIDLTQEAKKGKVAPAVGKAPILTDDYNPANLLLMEKK